MLKTQFAVLLFLTTEVSLLYAGPTKIPEESTELFEGDLRIPNLEETDDAMFDEPFELFEGDITIPQSLHRHKRNAVSDAKLLWPHGIVPYSISNRFNSTLRNLFRGAMNMIEDATQVNGKKCIEFVPRFEQKSYVHLEKSRDCSSDLGRQGNKRQVLTLGSQCYTEGTVVHELLHALGFFHEQSRMDRDKYIVVHPENIQQGTEQNFEKYPHTSLDNLDMPYDYDSIMHYKTDSFSKNKKNLQTITAKLELPPSIHIGQRDHLSIIDIWLIQKLYGCQMKEIETGDMEGSCTDKIPNCQIYGQYACTAFPAWSRDNCARTCKFCEPVCENKYSNCAQYGEHICSGEHESWAKANCAKYCSLGDCKPVTTPKPRQETTTTSSVCADKFNCSQFAKSACTIVYWYMKTNCPQHCSLCPAKKTITAKYTTPRQATTAKKAECVDNVDNCSSYINGFCDSYADWSKRNCAKFCGHCTPKVSTTAAAIAAATAAAIAPLPTCSDKIEECWKYTRNVCKTHPDWSSKNCNKFCGFCSLAATTPTTSTTTTTPTTTTTSTTTTKTTPTTTTTTTTPMPTQNQNCFDRLEDCSAYTTDVCESYPDWSKANCKSFCSMCERPEEASAAECADTIDDCGDYASDVCTSYPDWSKTNCPRHCGLCA